MKLDKFNINIDLKPCPFCGGTKLSVDCKTHNHYNGRHQGFSIRCNKCHARGGVVSGYTYQNSYAREEVCVISQDELVCLAVRKWNERV